MKEMSKIRKIISETVESELNKMNESGYSRMASIMRGLVPQVKTMAIITAENPYGQQADSITNLEANKKLEEILRKMNLGFTKVKGKYGGEENSYFVPNIRKDEALGLGKKFEQESIIFGQKIEEEGKDGIRFQMIYTDERMGEVIGQRDIFVGMEGEDDFYSEVKGRKFQIPFFDDEMDNASFKPQSGVIQKEGIDEKTYKLINDSITKSLNEENTAKSAWVNRGYVNNKLREIYSRK